MTNQNILEITDLNGYAQGVSRSDSGKIVFVDKALPGDVVEVFYTENSKRFSNAKILKKLLNPAHGERKPSVNILRNATAAKYKSLN